MEVLCQVKFDLKNVYKCHKNKSLDIEVDLIRFSFKGNKQSFLKNIVNVK